MSFILVLKCDRCRVKFPPHLSDGQSEETVLALADVKGWTRRHGHDYCRACTDAIREAAEAPLFRS